MSIDELLVSGVYSATTINVSGQDTSSVSSAFPPAFNSSQCYVANLPPAARLTASVGLNFSTVAVNGATGAELINDGSATLAGSQMTINADVLGIGSFQVSALVGVAVPDTGYLEFGDAVSRGETVTIGNPTIEEDGAFNCDELKIDQPRAFQGSVVLQTRGRDLQKDPRRAGAPTPVPPSTDGSGRTPDPGSVRFQSGGYRDPVSPGEPHERSSRERSGCRCLACAPAQPVPRSQ